MPLTVSAARGAHDPSRSRRMNAVEFSKTGAARVSTETAKKSLRLAPEASTAIESYRIRVGLGRLLGRRGRGLCCTASPKDSRGSIARSGSVSQASTALDEAREPPLADLEQRPGERSRAARRARPPARRRASRRPGRSAAAPPRSRRRRRRRDEQRRQVHRIAVRERDLRRSRRASRRWRTTRAKCASAARAASSPCERATIQRASASFDAIGSPAGGVLLGDEPPPLAAAARPGSASSARTSPPAAPSAGCCCRPTSSSSRRPTRAGAASSARPAARGRSASITSRPASRL